MSYLLKRIISYWLERLSRHASQTDSRDCHHVLLAVQRLSSCLTQTGHTYSYLDLEVLLYLHGHAREVGLIVAHVRAYALQIL